ncbi:MAG: hypothetical protein LUC90_12320, partial [Lachnospiraceae bacterium]|nr:hypothetical protein [Lachnospiraceae bacterium]
MDEFVTKISRNNYSQIRSREMTPTEIIQFLEDGALYRTFVDVLRAACKEQREADMDGRQPDAGYASVEESDSELTQRLARGLSELTGKEYASTLRKVRNWMNGSGTPQNREQLFQICFVLGLSEGQSDRLIAGASDYGIHYRNPKELVYAFALRTGLTYGEAVKLWEKAEPIYLEEVKRAEREDSVHKGESELVYTRQLRRDFGDVRTVDDLVNFFHEKGRWLGEIHESAYRKFMEMLNTLVKPEEGAKEYTLKKVMKTYLRMQVPYTKQTRNMSYLRRVIKKNWPSESEIDGMKNHRIDISRKTLLLLFLITEDFEFSSAPEA